MSEKEQNYIAELHGVTWLIKIKLQSNVEQDIYFQVFIAGIQNIVYSDPTTITDNVSIPTKHRV